MYLLGVYIRFFSSENVGVIVYITRDGGGSNGSWCHLWKYDLARLAEEAGLEIVVSYFPPGTSKWNRLSISCSAILSSSGRGSG
ncbi:ISAzo13-like element transposase-related protein [Allobaculum sp. JKK-2023]|uniref:ISAzo13-like element transposase-related protein n=1 Tax=Allobaculum sp. JKK-2023 TaxID=3108943 RepID=UPI003A59916D